MSCWFAEPSGALVRVNQRWRALSGTTDAQCLDDAWIALLHPDDAADSVAAWRRGIASGAGFERALRWWLPGDRELWTQLTAHPATDTTGATAGFVCTLLDVTTFHERGKLLRALSSRQVAIHLPGWIVGQPVREVRDTGDPPDTTRDRDALDVLVADDNPLNRAVFNAMLGKLGHRVVLVADGRAAVDAVRRHDFDIVLMDVQMPVMDGPSATREIREMDESLARTPIIAITADAIPERLDGYVRDGMDAYLVKPISLDALTSLLSGIKSRPV